MSSHRPLEAGSMASAASHADQQAQITLRDELPALEQATGGTTRPAAQPGQVLRQGNRPNGSKFAQKWA